MRIVSITAALLLAGCGPAQSPSDMASPSPDPLPETVAAASPTPTPEPARYIGRWAVEPKLCKDGAWRFMVLDLSTAGEVSCDFHKVRDTPQGYDADATCFAEGKRTEETLKLRFGESRDRMTVESPTFAKIELQRCTPAATTSAAAKGDAGATPRP